MFFFKFAGTVACIVLLTNLFDDRIPTQNWCLLSSWAAPASGRRKGTSKWKGQTTGTSQDGSWRHGNVGNWGNQWSTVMVYEVPLGSLLEVLENYDSELQLWFFTEAVCLHPCLVKIKPPTRQFAVIYETNFWCILPRFWLTHGKSKMCFPVPKTYIYSSEHAVDFLIHETLLEYFLEGEHVLSLDHVWSANVKMFFV